jgi:hypothetical protein
MTHCRVTGGVASSAPRPPPSLHHLPPSGLLNFNGVLVVQQDKAESPFGVSGLLVDLLLLGFLVVVTVVRQLRRPERPQLVRQLRRPERPQLDVNVTPEGGVAIVIEQQRPLGRRGTCT